MHVAKPEAGPRADSRARPALPSPEAGPQADPRARLAPPPRRRLVRAGRLHILVDPRRIVACGLLLLLTTLAFFAALGAGQVHLGLPEVVQALAGRGEPGHELLVVSIRLPRVVAAAAAGTALAISGCLTQVLAANRLATPDVLGVSQGATVAVMIGVLASNVAVLSAWWIGPLGAAGAAAVVTAVAGGIGRRGFRLLIAGIAVSTVAGSLVDVALARQDLGLARNVYAWTWGDLSGSGWSQSVPVLIGIGVLAACTLPLVADLELLRMGSDRAACLGVPVGRLLALSLGIAVTLAGLGVGVAGPIAFVALAGPVIASRIAGVGCTPIASGLAGAALCIAADTVGRVVAIPTEIPVGIVTTLVGGPLLIWVVLTSRLEEGLS